MQEKSFVSAIDFFKKRKKLTRNKSILLSTEKGKSVKKK